jgi:hypothetical protein
MGEDLKEGIALKFSFSQIFCHFLIFIYLFSFTQTLFICAVLFFFWPVSYFVP